MENIAQFVTLIKQKGGVAKKNRFRISITETGFPDNGRALSLLCESASFPSKTIQSFEFSSYRNPIKIPTGFANEDVSVVFHLTNDYYVKKIFDQWLNTIVDPDYFISYDSTFKRTIEIFQLDEKDQDVYGVKLIDAYPVSVSAVELDNTQTNATQKLTVDFTYNIWAPIIINSSGLDSYRGDINVPSDTPATNDPTNLPSAFA